MKVKLTHASFLKDAKGKPGDIVDVPDDLASRWLEDGGAVKITTEETKPEPTPKKAKGLSKANTKGDKDESDIPRE